MTTKSRSIKGVGRRSGGCALKAVELTTGDLPFVWNSGLREEYSDPTGRQKLAEGIVGPEGSKA